MKKLDLAFIKNRRLDLDITLQQMANSLGFKSKSTYLKYEKGEYAFKAEHLPVLETTLECRMENFFTQNVAKIETIGLNQ